MTNKNRDFLKVLIIQGFLVYFLFGFCYANDTTAPALNSSRIQFKERMYDFGIAGQDEEIIHEFIFRNAGNSPLQIRNLRTSCGCLAALLSGETIAPGESGILHVTFKTERYEGKQEKLIYVESNDPKEPKIELVIQGLIKTDIAVDPQGLLFGDVDKGRTISKKVKVFDLGKEELQLKEIQFNNKYFEVKNNKFKGQNNRGFELEIILKPDIPVGSFSEIITLHTNLLKRPRLDIPVWGNIVGEIKVEPKALPLGSLKKGDVSLNKIIISSETKAFKLTKVTCNLPFIEVLIAPIRGKKGFELTAKAGDVSPAGQFNGQIDIFTDHPEDKILHIPVYGTIQK